MALNDTKNLQILDAALAVFGRYGFRKTSMADIADTAGMSRAALYLHFRNKEDVFRSVSVRLHDEVMVQARAAFTQEGPVMARIEHALLAFVLGLLAPIAASEHGQELIDINMAVAADITGEAKQVLLALMTSALADADANGEIDLAAARTGAAELAETILAAADGLKHAESGLEKLPARLSLLIRLFDTALRPAGT